MMCLFRSDPIRIFSILEENKDRIRTFAQTNLVYHRQISLPLLRCSSLLGKRLGPQIFSRLLLFFASVFPLDDRSGVNNNGSYDTTVSTPIDPESAFSEQKQTKCV